MPRSTRRGYLAGIAALSTSGCVDSFARPGRDAERDDSSTGAGSSDDSRGVPLREDHLPLPDGTAALYQGLVATGVSRDGIPSIDDPSFERATDADGWLADEEPVFGVDRDGTVRAYPQRILVWHEIVNDRIAGENVAITYCPLTGTAQGFMRGGTTFGVTGRLLRNNLVLYDRHTESYWPQMLATAIHGHHAGDSLRELSITWTSWDRWRDTYPDTAVLSTETGYIRNYDNDPYGSYAPVGGYYDREVVIGTRSATGAVVVSKDRLSDAGLLTRTVDDVTYVAVADPTLGTGYFYRTTDDFTAEHEGERVMVDGTAYPPESLPFERTLRYDAFRFAWDGFYPDSEELM